MTEWHVIFFPRCTTHWSNWLAIGKWKHVACMRFGRSTGLWELYNYDPEGMRAEYLTSGAVKASVLEWQAMGAEIWIISQGTEMKPERNMVMSCVGMVKALVRRGRGALRPSALYRILRQEGAVRAWESTTDVQSPESARPGS